MEYYLIHHGIKGQKWGVRRFENEDGTLTEAGKKRYYDQNGHIKKKYRTKMHDKYSTKMILDEEDFQREYVRGVGKTYTKK